MTPLSEIRYGNLKIILCGYIKNDSDSDHLCTNMSLEPDENGMIWIDFAHAKSSGTAPTTVLPQKKSSSKRESMCRTRLLESDDEDTTEFQSTPSRSFLASEMGEHVSTRKLIWQTAEKKRVKRFKY
jgi:hypothetical protein